MSATRPDFETRVEHALDTFAEKASTRLGVLDADLAGFLEAVRDFVRGGKRMRARFCLAGWQLAGGDPADPRIIEAAAAFEWLQGSALAHDDLMDGSDLRRGRPSLHRAFEQDHRRLARRGNAAAYGEQVALLAGDLMLAWADDALHRAGRGTDTPALQRAEELWADAKTEVIAGQLLDVAAQTRDRLSVDDAMTVVRYKAAKYTVERPLHVGAALAGADQDLLAMLSAVAIPLGEAFQLRDDVLGVFGAPQATGKPAGDDLREGKRTVLIARTAELGDAGRLFTLLGTPEGVPELTAMIRDCGALAAVERDIDRLSERATTAVAALGPHAHDVLGPLLHAAVRRDR